MIYFETYTKLTENGEDWGKLIVARGFKKLPKVQNIAQSGHTAHWRQKQPLYQLRHNPRTYSSKHTFKRWEFVDAKPSLITCSQTASFIIFEKREIVATFRMEKLLVDWPCTTYLHLYGWELELVASKTNRERERGNVSKTVKVSEREG